MKKNTSTWYLNSKEFESWAYMEKYFTPEECDKVIEYGKKQNLIEAVVGEDSKTRVDSLVRKSNVSFFNSADPEIEWLYRKLTDAINYMNNRFWDFELDYLEILQFTAYDRIEDYYGPHMDMKLTGGNHRKLSFSLQLSAEEEYEGGDLIIGIGEKTPAKKGKGDLIFFPSFMYHEVTPITQGARYSLVGWVCGPKFK